MSTYISTTNDNPERNFCDFHLHSSRSDGMKCPDEVIEEAKRCGIGMLALTDHNLVTHVTDLRKENPDITIFTGCEFSCLYKEKEIHVVGLAFDKNHPKIQSILQRNQFDRKAHVTAMLEALEKVGVHIGTYDQLRAEYPESQHLGRAHLAAKIFKMGYTDSAESAMDEYIGHFGKRRAYVPNPFRYASMEETVDAILSASGVAVLCHLFFYRGDDAFNRKLVRYFKQLANERGAMETSYGRYSEPQRAYLRQLAGEYGLLHSAASDYHGKDSSETMDCKFPQVDFQPLIDLLCELELKHNHNEEGGD